MASVRAPVRGAPAVDGGCRTSLRRCCNLQQRAQAGGCADPETRRRRRSVTPPIGRHCRDLQRTEPAADLCDSHDDMQACAGGRSRSRVATASVANAEARWAAVAWNRPGSVWTAPLTRAHPGCPHELSTDPCMRRSPSSARRAGRPPAPAHCVRWPPSDARRHSRATSRGCASWPRTCAPPRCTPTASTSPAPPNVPAGAPTAARAAAPAPSRGSRSARPRPRGGRGSRRPSCAACEYATSCCASASTPA
jgi:hypothetical protein